MAMFCRRRRSEYLGFPVAAAAADDDYDAADDDDDDDATAAATITMTTMTTMMMTTKEKKKREKKAAFLFVGRAHLGRKTRSKTGRDFFNPRTQNGLNNYLRCGIPKLLDGQWGGTW